MSHDHVVPRNCRKTHFYGAQSFDLVRGSNGVLHSVVVHATRPSAHHRVLRLIDGEDERGLEILRVDLPPSSDDAHDAHALDEFEACHAQTIHNTNFDVGLFVVTEDPSDLAERARVASEHAPLLLRREELREKLRGLRGDPSARGAVLSELKRLKASIAESREVHPKDREDNGLEVTILYSSPRPKTRVDGEPPL